MMCLQYYDLEYEIINAKPTEILEPTETQIKRTKGLYNVNEPQARAILSAVTNSGFTLIQGYVITSPPPPSQSYSENYTVHLVQEKPRRSSVLWGLS